MGISGKLGGEFVVEVLERRGCWGFCGYRCWCGEHLEGFY